ncbi:MAG: carboxypeptidase regulatory-like domain-containing protein [bacterium]
MKTAVQKIQAYTVILLTALAVICVGLQKSVCAQIVKDPLVTLTAPLTDISKVSSSQPSLLDLMGGSGFPSLIGMDLSLSMAGLNPALNPFISSPSLAASSVLMSALNGNALMSAAVLSQAMAGGISPGVGMGGAVYPVSATGGGLVEDPSFLMNLMGFGSGLFPGIGSALSNISFPIVPIVPFLADQGRSTGFPTGLYSSLMVPPLNPFGMASSAFAALQMMGGYPTSYGSTQGMPYAGMPGVSPVTGGGYSSPFTNPTALSAGSSPYPYLGDPRYAAGGLPVSQPSGTAPLSATGTGSFGGYGANPAYFGYQGLTIGNPPVINPAANMYDSGFMYSPIRLGVIYGVVQDQKGESIVGATITIISNTGVEISSLKSGLPLGNYGVSKPFPGTGCSLKISHPYGKPDTQYPSFPVAGNVRCDFILLEGTVQDAIKKIPLSQVGIFAIAPDASLLEAQTTTDDDGEFAIFLPKGTYSIVAKLPLSGTSSTNRQVSSVTIPMDNAAKLSFDLSLPLLIGNVIDAIDDTINMQGALIQITPSSSIQMVPVKNPVKVGKGGEFTIPLPEGAYTLSVTKSGYKNKTVTVQIKDTGLEDYHIELERTAPLTPVNNPPVIQSPPDGWPIPVEAGKAVDFYVMAQDPDLKDVQLGFTIIGLKGLPQGWTVGKEEGGQNGVPKRYVFPTTLADLGEYPLEITVTDFASPSKVNVTVKVQYSMQWKLTKGVNLISCPAAGASTSLDSAFDLLSILGDANRVESVSRYDSSKGGYVKASNIKGGKKTGTDFPINRQEGYIVYAKQAAPVDLYIQSGNLASCKLQIKRGTNLVGIPVVFSGTYSSYDLLIDLGQDAVESIYHYNPKAGGYEYTYWIGNLPGGSDFPIQIGEGYYIQGKADKQLSLPALL